MRKIKLKEESYVHIQAFMINDLHLKGNELMVYAMIHGFTQQEDQWTECSLAYIAAWIGVTNKKTPMNCINSLLEKGLLEKKEEYKNGVKFCQYRAITPSDKQNKDKKKNIPHEEKEGIQVEKNFSQGINKNSTPLDNIVNTIDENIDNTIDTYPYDDDELPFKIDDNSEPKGSELYNSYNSKPKGLEIHNSRSGERERRISMSLGSKSKQDNSVPLKDMPTRAREMAMEILCDGEESFADDVGQCVGHVVEKYKDRNRAEHPHLKNETLCRVVETMLSSITIFQDGDLENTFNQVFFPLVSYETSWEDRKEVIDKYFETDFKYLVVDENGEEQRAKVDYSLVHFTQGNVLTCVMQKCHIGRDMEWFCNEPVS